MATNRKCTEEAKTHAPEDMREELERDASAAGCTFAELASLRAMIYLTKKGVTYGEHVANHRRTVLLGTGQQQGHKVANEP